MPPLPTPDPSAPLTAYQAYAVAIHGWFGDLGQLMYLAGVTGLALLAFGLGVGVILWAMGGR